MSRRGMERARVTAGHGPTLLLRSLAHCTARMHGAFVRVGGSGHAVFRTRRDESECKGYTHRVECRRLRRGEGASFRRRWNRLRDLPRLTRVEAEPMGLRLSPCHGLSSVQAIIKPATDAVEVGPTQLKSGHLPHCCLQRSERKRACMGRRVDGMGIRVGGTGRNVEGIARSVGGMGEGVVWYGMAWDGSDGKKTRPARKCRRKRSAGAAS